MPHGNNFKLLGNGRYKTNDHSVEAVLKVVLACQHFFFFLLFPPQGEELAIDVCACGMCVCWQSMLNPSHTRNFFYTQRCTAEQKGRGWQEGVMMCDKSMLESICPGWCLGMCVHMWYREAPYHISLLQLAAHGCCVSKDVSQKEKVDEECIPYLNLKWSIEVEKGLDRDMQQTQAGLWRMTLTRWERRDRCSLCPKT